MRREISEKELDETFDEVRMFVRAKRYDAALEMCNTLMPEWPEKERHHLFDHMAYVYDRMGKAQLALDAISQALELDKTWAGHWDFRMILAIDLGRYDLAVSDSTSLIELEQRRGSIAFVESARVYRAYAQIELGEIERALNDLSMVNDAGPFRIAGKWWLKSELVELAQARK